MIYWVAALVFALDQAIKEFVRVHMTPYQLYPVLPPVLYWDYIRNPGGAFGILPNAQWLFLLVAVLVVGVAIYVDRKYHPNRLTKFALGLVVAGALGNLTDRVVSHSVTDFIYFRIINFPIFNVADMAIDIGIFLLILRSFVGSREEEALTRETKDVNE